MTLRNQIIAAIAAQERLAPTDREVHEAMADAVLSLVVSRSLADGLADAAANVLKELPPLTQFYALDAARQTLAATLAKYREAAEQ